MPKNTNTLTKSRFIYDGGHSGLSVDLDEQSTAHVSKRAFCEFVWEVEKLASMDLSNGYMKGKDYTFPFILNAEGNVDKAIVLRDISIVGEQKGIGTEAWKSAFNIELEKHNWSIDKTTGECRIIRGRGIMFTLSFLAPIPKKEYKKSKENKDSNVFLLDGKPFLNYTEIRCSANMDEHGKFWISTTGNPTSLLTMQNSQPCSEPISVDLLALPQRVVLDVLNLSERKAFEKYVSNIEKGEITLHALQMAQYIRSTNTQMLLNTFVIAYGSVLPLDGMKTRSLANLLGLKFQCYYEDPVTENYLTGFSIAKPIRAESNNKAKAKNKSNLWSISGYLKDVQGTKTGKSRMWSEDGQTYSKSGLRLDITISKYFFPILFNQAEKAEVKANLDRVPSNNKRYKPTIRNVVEAIRAMDVSEIQRCQRMNESLEVTGFMKWLHEEVVMERANFLSFWPIINPKSKPIKNVKKFFVEQAENRKDYSKQIMKAHKLWKKNPDISISKALEQVGVPSSARTRITKQLTLYTRGLSPAITSGYVGALKMVSFSIGRTKKDLVKAITKWENTGKLDVADHRSERKNYEIFFKKETKVNKPFRMLGKSTLMKTKKIGVVKG